MEITKKQNFPSAMVRRGRMKAFTLVELIIVITILAILATIAFMSFQGYTSKSRDANRVSTMKNIENGLEIFFTKSGTVPSPDSVNGNGTISGNILVQVGSIGDSIARQINLNTHPKDPLNQTAYVYGTDTGNRFYQIGIALETQTVQNPIVGPIYADSQFQAKVTGNYGGLLTYNGMIYNVPSLLFNGSGNLLSGQTYFIVDKGQNIPFGKENSHIGGEIFRLVGSTATTLTGVNLSSSMESYKANFLMYTKPLGYEVDSIGKVIYGKTYTTTHITCDTGIEEISLGNGQIWACKNLGATSVRDGSTKCVNGTSCHSQYSWAGYYYQWGRNEPITGNFLASTYSGPLTNGNVGGNDMYRGSDTYEDWWENESGSGSPTRWSGEKTQGPCPTNRHVPLSSEWKLACDTISDSNCAVNATTVTVFQSRLRIPFTGYRHGVDGGYNNQADQGSYWSGNASSTQSHRLGFGINDIYPESYFKRSFGYPIRCLKN